MDSKSNKWFVTWQVPAVSGDKLHISGPYTSKEAAEYDRADIAGYEGVFYARVFSENADELLDAKLASTV